LTAGCGGSLTFDTECLAEAVYDGILVDLGRLHPVSLSEVCEGSTDVRVAECGCVRGFFVGCNGGGGALLLLMGGRAGVVWVVGIVSRRLSRDDELVWGWRTVV
jgi:hypothetical protein